MDEDERETRPDGGEGCGAAGQCAPSLAPSLLEKKRKKRGETNTTTTTTTTETVRTTTTVRRVSDSTAESDDDERPRLPPPRPERPDRLVPSARGLREDEDEFRYVCARAPTSAPASSGDEDEQGGSEAGAARRARARRRRASRRFGSERAGPEPRWREFERHTEQLLRAATRIGSGRAPVGEPAGPGGGGAEGGGGADGDGAEGGGAEGAASTTTQPASPLSRPTLMDKLRGAVLHSPWTDVPQRLLAAINFVGQSPAERERMLSAPAEQRVQDKDVASLDHANLGRFLMLLSDVRTHNEALGVARGAPCGLLTFPGDTRVSWGDQIMLQRQRRDGLYTWRFDRFEASTPRCPAAEGPRLACTPAGATWTTHGVLSTDLSSADLDLAQAEAARDERSTAWVQRQRRPQPRPAGEQPPGAAAEALQGALQGGLQGVLQGALQEPRASAEVRTETPLEVSDDESAPLAREETLSTTQGCQPPPERCARTERPQRPPEEEEEGSIRTRAS
eukprot:5503544-Prymnesium_polylepis.1